MTVSIPAKTSSLYANLTSANSKDKLIEALRLIKNSIIGNPTRKRTYLHLGISIKYFHINVRLVNLLNDSNQDLELMVELAPIIGSLAQYDTTNLIAAGVTRPLFLFLDSTDHRVAESCARAIRAIVQQQKCINSDTILVYLIT
jgi:hypothetical protein